MCVVASDMRLACVVAGAFRQDSRDMGLGRPRCQKYQKICPFVHMVTTQIMYLKNKYRFLFFNLLFKLENSFFACYKIWKFKSI